MSKHRTAVMGLGVRGKTHLKALLENAERYEIVGICDIRPEVMDAVEEMFSLSVPKFTDVEEMLSQTRPEVFVFVTYPDLRLSMIELAVKYGVKAVSFEKPMAENMEEAKKMTDLCIANGIKAVVCHQQKYLKQMQELKAKVDRGDLGKIKKIFAECQPWMAQLGTHYMDYIIWVNQGARAKSVIGHVHGPATMQDDHPSPDFLFGEILFENGTRGYLECGYFAEQHNPDMYRDSDNRLTVWGEEGYAYAETDGYWGECSRNTGSKLVKGKKPGWYHFQEKEIQTPYYTEYADWLDDDKKVHACNIETALHGYEILEAIVLSALDNRRVDLPLTDFSYEPVMERMKKELPWFEDCDKAPRDLYKGDWDRPERDDEDDE